MGMYFNKDDDFNSLLPNTDTVVDSSYLDIYTKSYKSVVDLAQSSIPGAELTESISVPENLQTPPNTPICNKGFLKGICLDGHHFAKQLLCNKEYCLTCGAQWSYAHQRRYFRWLPKLKTMESVYYLVISPPRETWHLFKDKKKLNEFRKYIKRFMIYKGYEKGLIRWHWYGDCKICKGQDESCSKCKGTGAGTEFYPHLNLLFDAEYINDLCTWKFKFAWKLKKMFGIDIKQCVVNGKFYNNEKQKFHKLRYVTRATFRIYDAQIASLLYRYHTGTTWGNWKGKIDSNDIDKLEKSTCPLCDKPIEWVGMDMDKLDHNSWSYMKAGYWVWHKRELNYIPKNKSP